MTNSASWRPILECRGCHSRELSTVFEMEEMPLAGQFCRSRTEAVAAARFPLTWVECGVCGLAQVLEDVSDSHLFTNYNYSSSTVPGLVRHFEGYAAELAKTFGRGSAVSLLEIGANDGILLRRLPESWRLVGVDPSDVALSASAGAPYELINAPFSEELARDESLFEKFDIVTGSNCLAHVSNIKGILRSAWLALRPGGAFIVEVHDLETTLTGGQWDTIYHEHKVEWSRASLAACAAAVGFELVEVFDLPLHGGLIRACFRKSEAINKATLVRTSEGFEALRRAYRARRGSHAYRALRAEVDRGNPIYAYGASGRANVWLNQLPELPFEHILDSSPIRAGKWLPHVGVPVLPVDEMCLGETATYLITAWNYEADIRARHPDFAGRWLRTFPQEQAVGA